MVAPSAVPLYFPPTPNPTSGPSHLLLELPAEILKMIDQQSEDKPLSLTIKGRPTDEAVLCTPSKTYAIRSVQVSNELVLFAPTAVVPSFWEEGAGLAAKALEVRDTLHEMLELSECVPRVGRIEHRKRTKYTLAHLKSIIQSSDAELVSALHDQNVITVNDRLVPLPPLQLSSFLSLLLRTLVLCSDDNPPLSVPTALLLPSLKEHGVSADFAEAALSRFGTFSDVKGSPGRTWTMAEDGKDVVREIGRGVLVGKLAPHKPVPLPSFMSLWQDAVPDVFQPLISLDSLSGSYLLDPPPNPSLPSTLTPFPLSHLPLDAPSRFADLFTTRPRWLLKDLKPFLRDLAGDEKGRERLVARFGRLVKERVVSVPVGNSAGWKKEKGGGGGGGGEMVEIVYARNK